MRHYVASSQQNMWIGEEIPDFVLERLRMPCVERPDRRARRGMGFFNLCARRGLSTQDRLCDTVISLC